MEIFALFVVVAVLVAFIFYMNLAPREHSGKVSPLAQRKRKPSYAARSLSCGSGPCDAVRDIENKRYLIASAPKVPLFECDVLRCNCKYNHHDDRREESEDRRLPNPLSTQLYASAGNVERRNSVGRRASDWLAAKSAVY